MVRADQGFAAKFSSTVEHLFEVIHSGLTNFGVGRNRVRVSTHHGHSGTAKTFVFQKLAKPLVLLGIFNVEQRNFNGIISDRFQFLDDGDVGFGHDIGPQQQVHSGFEHVLRGSWD